MIKKALNSIDEKKKEHPLNLLDDQHKQFPSDNEDFKIKPLDRKEKIDHTFLSKNVKKINDQPGNK
jgi:hypothetical protein